jgi:hypothetical protein
LLPYRKVTGRFCAKTRNAVSPRRRVIGEAEIKCRLWRF